MAVWYLSMVVGIRGSFWIFCPQEEPHGEEIWNASAIAGIKEGVSEVEEVFELGFGPKWAQEYLEASEHKL